MRALAAFTLLLAACAGSEATQSPSTEAPIEAVSTTIGAETTTTATTSSTPTAPSTATTAPPPDTTTAPLVVTSPGWYEAEQLQVHIRFDSRVDDVSTAELSEQAIATLNDAGGWNESGFTFVADESSELMVVLAEGDVVDALCLPLDTFGKVSCQNGAVVALNADRWRSGGDDWDGTVESYRVYLVNHEVGHLIGLRHPIERCPTDSKISALMEPQTNNLLDCTGNGIPLDWELVWARQRPAFVGPKPDWDGPRPGWPTGS